jgi:LytS/YehU family sensor histidine kinase
VIITVSISLTVFSILIWLQKKHPWNKGILKRLFLEIILTYPVAIGMILFFSVITYALLRPPYVSSFREHLFEGALVSFIMNTVLVAISEGIFFFDQWKHSLVEQEKLNLEKEKLEKENIEIQYETLKNQVNPHFLFNSLNVLSSLIQTDPSKAEEFVDEFASVYRYVLEVNEKSLVTVNEELEFIRSYLFLQKIRFDKSLSFRIDIPESVLFDFIPPLALQIVLENTIKHNLITRDKPLFVEIYTDNSAIIVKNNLQPRSDRTDSTGIGLNNLRERYSLFHEKLPQFTQDHQHYIARLPLITHEP